MPYKISEFVTLSERAGRVALHNNKTRRTRFLDKKSFDLLGLMTAPDAPHAFDGCKRSALLRMLAKEGMVVPRDHDENKAYLEWAASLQARAKSTMQVLYIFPTLACNFKCRYCLIENNMKGEMSNAVLDFEKAKVAIDYFLANNDASCGPNSGKTIIFYGGEPLLEAELVFKCIDYAAAQIVNRQGSMKKVRFVINTNGSLIDEEIIRSIKARDNIQLIISLDGQKEANDEMRTFHNGKGTFDVVLSKIRMLETAKVKYVISLTVGTHNVGNLEQHVFSLFDIIRPRGIGFNIVNVLDSGMNPALEKGTERDALIDTVHRVGRLLYERKGILEDKTYACRWRQFRDTSCKTCFFTNCPGMGEQIVVSPSGKIGPCHAYVGSNKYFIDQNDAGNDIYEHEIWKKWSRCSPVFRDYCLERRCNEIDLCGGGCSYESDVLFGDIYTPHPDHCEFVKRLKDQYIWQKYDMSHMSLGEKIIKALGIIRYRVAE